MWPHLQTPDRELTRPFLASILDNILNKHAQLFVFFDAGMILYDLDWDLFAARVADLFVPRGFDPARFRQALVERGVMRDWERGLSGPSAFCEAFYQALKGAQTQPGTLTLDWPNPIVIKHLSSSVIGNVRRPVLDLVNTLRTHGVGTGVLSNATAWHESDLLLQCDLRAHFDAVLFSQDFGLAKPDPAFFEAAERVAHGVLKSTHVEILFVDDTPANVRGAVAAGWKARMPDLLKRRDLWQHPELNELSQQKQHLSFGDEAAARVRELFAPLVHQLTNSPTLRVSRTDESPFGKK